MFDFEPFARCFGGAPDKPKETQADRSSRLLRTQQSDLDARALRMRRKRLARGRQASSLFGGSEGASLGAGL